ncbi:MAG: Crp/Fnr family transcriptional regulator [Rhodobacteraceae bacterium]|nr:MAG: Crp/Fnr family transcriptional regulator [Paracoccaceae bacterium]
MTSTTSDHPCKGCAFHRGSVWQPVERADLAHLHRGFTRRDLAAGQRLYAQDDANGGVFCVSSGLIAVRTHHAEGTSTLLKLAYPGDIIGYRSFLAGARHKTEASALLPSRVCIVARRDAARVVQASPAVLARLAGRCVEEIDSTHARIIAASVSQNRDRLRALLAHLMQRHGRRQGDRLRMRLPLSRSDLADLIGVRPETMSRLLRQLKDEGSLTVSGREISMALAAPPAGANPERRPRATPRRGAAHRPASPDPSLTTRA